VSSFTAPLKATLIEGSRNFRIEEGYSFYIDMPDGVRRTFYVNQGFETDFASIPKVFWSFIDPLDPEIAKITPVHDRLYIVGNVDRWLADLVLLEGMKVLGASKIKRYVVYAGVRLAGWYYWNKRRRS